MIVDFIRQLERMEELSPEVIDKKDFEFDNLSIPDREEAFAQMDQIFESNQNFDKKYKFSYFRWYTDFAWKFFNNRDQDFIINIAMARQVPMAILLDFEVWRSIMSYLAMRTVDDQDMQALYFRMKESFLNSEAVVGRWQDKEVLVKDLVSEIKKLNAKPKDSMAQAEFESRLQQIIFNKEDKKFANYIFTDPDTAIDRFIGLVHFFLGIDEKDIWNMVDSFLHPEKFEVSGQANIESNAKSGNDTVDFQSPDSTDQSNQENADENDTELSSQLSEEAAISKIPSYSEIKSQIEQEFKKDSEGNFENIELVFRKLEEFTEMYNDPKIADLLYFDEESGEFKWRV